MTESPKILAFAGSTREDSFNKKLVKIAVEKAINLGADVTLIDLRDFPMPLYDGDIEEKDGIPGNGLKLREIFHQHDGLVIASPEYNSSFSAVLKNAIDWVSRPESGKKPLYYFRGKTALLLAASPTDMGGKRCEEDLRRLLTNIMVTVLDTHVLLAKADQAFNDDDSLISEEKELEVESAVKELVEALFKKQ